MVYNLDPTQQQCSTIYDTIAINLMCAQLNGPMQHAQQFIIHTIILIITTTKLNQQIRFTEYRPIPRASGKMVPVIIHFYHVWLVVTISNYCKPCTISICEVYLKLTCNTPKVSKEAFGDCWNNISHSSPTHKGHQLCITVGYLQIVIPFLTLNQQHQITEGNAYFSNLSTVSFHFISGILSSSISQIINVMNE